MTKTPVPATQLGGHADLTGLEAIVSTRVTIQIEVLKVFTDGLLLTLLAVLGEDPAAQWVDIADRRSSWRARQPWLGVKFSDGRGAVYVAGRPRPGAAIDSPAVKPLLPYPSPLSPMMWLPFFITPAPPPGPMTVVIAWPEYGLSEHCIHVEARVLEDAARRVVSLA